MYLSNQRIELINHKSLEFKKSPITISHNGIELSVIPLTGVVGEHRPWRTISPASIHLPPAPEVLFSPLFTIVLTLLPVVGHTGGGGAEVRIPPLAQTTGGFVTPSIT